MSLHFDADDIAPLGYSDAWARQSTAYAVMRSRQYQPRPPKPPALPPLQVEKAARPKKSRAEYQAAWRKKAKGKWLASQARYGRSPKGKAVKRKVWAKWYAKHREELLARRRTPEGRAKQAESDRRYRQRHAEELAARRRAQRAAAKAVSP